MLNEVITSAMVMTNAATAVETTEQVTGLAKVGKFVSDHKTEIIVGAGCTAVGAGVAVACCHHAAKKNGGVLRTPKESLEHSKEIAKQKKAEREAKKAEKKCNDVKQNAAPENKETANASTAA